MTLHYVSFKNFSLKSRYLINDVTFVLRYSVKFLITNLAFRYLGSTLSREPWNEVKIVNSWSSRNPFLHHC